jgi:hypothetical protein
MEIHLMSHPDPTGFTSPSTLLVTLASDLRQCADRSSGNFDDRLDPVGVVNFSVVLEELLTGHLLSVTEAIRYFREVLCKRDPNNRDLYEQAAKGLSAPRRMIASDQAVQAKNNAQQEAREALRAATQKDIRAWRLTQQTPLPPPPGDTPSVEPPEDVTWTG